jgi:ABC-2 type transport system permease protein
MKILWNMTLAEWRINRRNIVLLIATILLPLLLVILFGGLYGNELTPKNLQLFSMGAVSASTPAYLALALGIIALTGMPQQLVGYKENKVLKRLKATPVRKYQILLPIFFIYIALFLIGMVLLLAYAYFRYDVKLQGNFASFLLSLVLSLSAMFSFGFLLSCLCKNSKQVNAVGFTLLVPMLFLSGATMPMGAFPDVMGKISKAIPLTYCVEFMKATFTGTATLGECGLEIAVLAGITLICTILSLVTFRFE